MVLIRMLLHPLHESYSKGIVLSISYWRDGHRPVHVSVMVPGSVTGTHTCFRIGGNDEPLGSWPGAGVSAGLPCSCETGTKFSHYSFQEK